MLLVAAAVLSLQVVHPCDAPPSSSVMAPWGAVVTLGFCVPPVATQSVDFCRILVDGVQTWLGPVTPIGPRSLSGMDYFEVALNWREMRLTVFDLNPGTHTANVACARGFAGAYSGLSGPQTIQVLGSPLPSGKPVVR